MREKHQWVMLLIDDDVTSRSNLAQSIFIEILGYFNQIYRICILNLTLQTFCLTYAWPSIEFIHYWPTNCHFDTNSIKLKIKSSHHRKIHYQITIIIIIKLNWYWLVSYSRECVTPVTYIFCMFMAIISW